MTREREHEHHHNKINEPSLNCNKICIRWLLHVLMCHEADRHRSCSRQIKVKKSYCVAMTRGSSYADSVSLAGPCERAKGGRLKDHTKAQMDKKYFHPQDQNSILHGVWLLSGIPNEENSAMLTLHTRNKNARKSVQDFNSFDNPHCFAISDRPSNCHHSK